MPATVFSNPIFPGAKVVTAELTVTNTSGSYSNTVTDNRIVGSMKAYALEIGDPSVFNDKISITSNAGSYTVACNDVAGETTIKISFLKIDDDPTAVTSTEYDTLDLAKVNKTDIANNLTTETEGKVLDARQGKALSGKTVNLQSYSSCANAYAALSDKQHGFAQVASAPDAPVANTSWQIETWRDSSTFGWQKATHTSDNKVYQRHLWTGNWSSWESLSDQIGNKINTSAIKNNVTTNSSGYVLDARQGKVINDKIENNPMRLKVGTNTITVGTGRIILTGFITGSGNYIDVFIPLDTSGISSISSVTTGSSSDIYAPTATLSIGSKTSVEQYKTPIGIQVEFATGTTLTDKSRVASLRTSELTIVCT